MSIQVIYFQPEYVEKFKCDGNFCNSRCCKGWRIEIDNDTFKRYAEIESDDKEISSHIKFSDNRNVYFVKLEKDGRCPFLNDENLCSIQKKYGEKFLSAVCQTYPRNVYLVDNFFERSLTLTCPLAAELALLQDDPIKFHTFKETVPDDKPPRVISFELPPPEIFSRLLTIQITAIHILQERTLKIDQRLAMLGIFLESLEEFIQCEKYNQIDDLLKKFNSKSFIYEIVQSIWFDLKFNPERFIKVVLNSFMEILYTNDEFKTFDGEIFNSFKKNFNLNLNEDENILNEMVLKKFVAVEKLCDEFVQRFETIFENYLVNEFFMWMYPWRLPQSMTHNFGVFIASYKLVELFTFVNSLVVPNADKKEIVKFISYFSTKIDHNSNYIKKISDALQDITNSSEIILTFLRTGNI